MCLEKKTERTTKSKTFRITLNKVRRGRERPPYPFRLVERQKDGNRKMLKNGKKEEEGGRQILEREARREVFRPDVFKRIPFLKKSSFKVILFES